MVKDNKFDELKSEYSNPKTIESRKKELIMQMQENLRTRRMDDRTSIKCLNGNECSFDSNNVEDLYAIDAKLNYDADNKLRQIGSDIYRSLQTSKNNYNKNNPYSEK